MIQTLIEPLVHSLRSLMCCKVYSIICFLLRCLAYSKHIQTYNMVRNHGCLRLKGLAYINLELLTMKRSESWCFSFIQVAISLPQCIKILHFYIIPACIDWCQVISHPTTTYADYSVTMYVL